jgi:hypothetical protein
MRSGICGIIISIVLCAPALAYDWSTNPGSGTPENPYQISEPNHLIAIGSNPDLLDKHFILTNDIIFDPNTNPAHVFTQALIAPDVDSNLIYFQGPVFEGVFNGNQNKLLNLKFISPINDYLGLFGAIGWSGDVNNLIIENIIIEGRGKKGGLAGHNNGTISNSSVICSITGEGGIGALACWNEGLILNCRSDGFIYSGGLSGNMGGLVGLTKGGSISNCFSSVNCVGAYNIGGLIGFATGPTLLNCYSVGNLTGFVQNAGGLIGSVDGGGIVSNCYFLNTAGPDNGYGTPLDEPNMRMQANFFGWDFLGESANGVNEIWRMCVDGVDYPRLSWEFARNGDFACADGVDLADLLALAENWLIVGTAHPAEFNTACDANGDERIDLADFDILAENWPVP